jgi:hypothetical protein
VEPLRIVQTLQNVNETSFRSMHAGSRLQSGLRSDESQFFRGIRRGGLREWKNAQQRGARRVAGFENATRFGRSAPAMSEAGWGRVEWRKPFDFGEMGIAQGTLRLG